jgi:hypothetical protein
MSVVQSVLAFGFVSPWLLAGGLALSAVPVVIHLLRRRNYIERPWAAMQFLQAAIRSQSRRVRLESIAVLLVRTALIAVAAAAIAQPYFDEDDAVRESLSGRERILVIDTSLSMSAGQRGRPHSTPGTTGTDCRNRGGRRRVPVDPDSADAAAERHSACGERPASVIRQIRGLEDAAGPTSPRRCEQSNQS